MHHWHIITGEYPPQFGGVSDYTRLLANGLCDAGDEVEVWAPACGVAPSSSADARVIVHRLPGNFGPSALLELERSLRRRGDAGRVLVQYVPQMYGWKAMNVGFCSWLCWRSDLRPWVMFHEVATPRVVGQPVRHRVLSAVTRRMAGLVARAAQRVFVSVPSWEDLVRDVSAISEPITWLPIPSTVPTQVDAGVVTALRRQFEVQDANLVGHFGTFGAGLVAELLAETMPRLLLTNTERHALLLGRGSCGFAETLLRIHPELSGRIHARADLTPEDIAAHLAACDLLVQPYPDGVSSRRTSVMAGLALGRPIVTTIGPATEPIWVEQQLVAAAPVGDFGALENWADQLLADSTLRETLGLRAKAGYEQNFSLRRTIDTLRACA